MLFNMRNRYPQNYQGNQMPYGNGYMNRQPNINQQQMNRQPNLSQQQMNRQPNLNQQQMNRQPNINQQQIKQQPMKPQNNNPPQQDPSIKYEPLTDDILKMLGKSEPQNNDPNQNTMQKNEVTYYADDKLRDGIFDAVQSEYNAVRFYKELQEKNPFAQNEQSILLTLLCDATNGISADLQNIYKDIHNKDFEPALYHSSNITNTKNGLQYALVEEAKSVHALSDMMKSCHNPEHERSLVAVLFKKISNISIINSIILK